MRSLLSRVAIPVGALSFLSLAATNASAETFKVHLGGKYQGPPASDVASRGRSIVDAFSPSAKSLAVSSVDTFGDGDTIVRYEEMHRGLLVVGHGASVRFGANGQPIATITNLASDLPSSIIPAVVPDVAATIATNRVGYAAHARDAHLVVWPTRDRGARLAYVVLPKMPGGIPSAPRIVIDAQSGEIIEARDMVQFAKARMYEFNPTKSPTLGTYDLALTPVGGYLTNDFVEASNCIDKKSVKPVSVFGFNLNVHVCDLVQVAKADAGGDFLYDPADQPGTAPSKKDEFSEVSIYYHTAKAYQFFRQLQGSTDAQVVVDKPLKVVSNLQIPSGASSGNFAAAGDPEKPLEPFQNAFFSPAGGGLGQLFQQLYGFDKGALWFGQGPTRDYAYDGDVVYHEFGHAVVDNTLKLGAWHIDARGAIDAPGAMNEGLADYFSSAITGDPAVGEYAGTDFGGEAGVIRTLANQDKCPTAIVGEVHYDSTLFSGGLWEARSSLPEGERAKFDAALYKAMRSSPGNGDLGYDDLAKLFLTTLKTDLPSGAAALEKAMTGRGVLPTCERILTLESGKTVNSPESRFGFAAPGIQAAGVKGTAPGIIQVKVALPKRASVISVTFAAKTGGGGGGNPLGGNASPAKLVVLAKYGAPITWNPKNQRPHDADIKVDAVGKDAMTATIEVTEDIEADAVYLQIANTGESDGSYDKIGVSIETRPGGPEETAPPTNEPLAQNDSGCACNTPGTSSNTSGLAGILAAAGVFLLGARSRRKR